jgi:hypothetical protein
MHWLSFIGGLFIGGLLGVFVMCLCAVAGEADRTETKAKHL